jgi:hypothetical protein
LALAVLCNGCDSVNEAWTSPLGVRMAAGPLQDYFSPEQVDAHARAAVGDLLSAGYCETQLWPAVPLQVVEVYPGRVPHWGQENGATVGNGLKVTAAPCVWGTALRHEMVHQLEAHVGAGTYDYAHRASYWAHADEPLGGCP